MLNKLKSYLWTFFAGAAATALACLAISNKRTTKPQKVSPTEVELAKAEEAAVQLKQTPVPKDPKEQKEFLMDEGYLK